MVTTQSLPKQSELLSKAKNGATRTKWLFGIFAGLIAIIDNSIFEPLLLTKKFVILFSLLGAVVNTFAMTKFEQVQFELERLITNDATFGEKESCKKLFDIYNDAIKYMLGAIILGTISGIILLVNLFHPELEKLCSC